MALHGCAGGNVLALILENHPEEGQVIHELEVAETEAFGEITLTETASASGLVRLEDEDFGRLDQRFVRVRSVDLAGNVSETSQPIAMRTDATSACTTGPAAAQGVLASVLALCLIRRRESVTAECG